MNAYTKYCKCLEQEIENIDIDQYKGMLVDAIYDYDYDQHEEALQQVCKEIAKDLMRDIEFIFRQENMKKCLKTLNEDV